MVRQTPEVAKEQLRAAIERGDAISGTGFMCCARALLKNKASKFDIAKVYTEIIRRLRQIADDEQLRQRINEAISETPGLLKLSYDKGGLYSAKPGSLKIGTHTVSVSAQQRDEFLLFVQEYADNVLESLDERVPDEKLLRALIKLYDTEAFRAQVLDVGDGYESVLAAYGVEEVATVGGHFCKGRVDAVAAGDADADEDADADVTAGELFINAGALRAEYSKFKVTDLVKWKDLTFEDVLKAVATQKEREYPNLWRLANTLLVLVVTNAACESGFSIVKLTKGDLQGHMETETLDARMFVKLHGPKLDDDAGVKALCTEVARRYWLEKPCVPARAAGGRAAAKANKKNRALKRKAEAIESEAKTADANAGIAATGDPTDPRPSFEDQHGEKYVAQKERPKIGPDMKKARVAMILYDGTWVLGRIKSVQEKKVGGADGAAASVKYRFTWKESDGSNEHTRVRFSKRTYGTGWVVFESKAKKAKK